MAWRNIWRNKTRSLVIIASVAIGVFAGLGVLALYRGMLSSRVRTVIDAEVSHIQMHHPGFKNDYDPSLTIADAAGVLRQLQSMPEIKLAAPRVIVQGMLVTTTGSAGVQINGIEPELEYNISQLKQKIVRGVAFSHNKKNQILLGKKLADKMKLKTASKLVLTFTDTAGNLVSAAFRVAGIYQSANAPLDELNVYVQANELQELLTSGLAYHEIAVLLKSDQQLEFAQSKLKQLFPWLLFESWKEISPETDLMVKTIDVYSYIIFLIILIALAFGILNTMLMSILERTPEIGMLAALGTSRIRIFLMVFSETLWLTFAGTPFGLLAAYIIIKYFEQHGLDLSGMGREMMAGFGYSTTVFPSFPWDKLPAILAMVTATALLSCLLPAAKALRLQPVEALRK